MEKKPMTIKDAQISDIDYLTELRSSGLTSGGALHHVIEQCQLVDSLKQENKGLSLQLEELSNREPEKVTEQVETIVEVPIKLQGREFITDMGAEVSDMARKCRSWVMKDYPEIKPEQYPAELVKIAVKTFLERKYDHVINR